MDQYRLDVPRDAAELLGLSKLDANYLFSAKRTISEIHMRSSRLINGDERGYGRDGRDRSGNPLPLIVVKAE